MKARGSRAIISQIRAILEGCSKQSDYDIPPCLYIVNVAMKINETKR
jgi:hypothetical protein